MQSCASNVFSSWKYKVSVRTAKLLQKFHITSWKMFIVRNLYLYSLIIIRTNHVWLEFKIVCSFNYYWRNLFKNLSFSRGFNNRPVEQWTKCPKCPKWFTHCIQTRAVRWLLTTDKKSAASQWVIRYTIDLHYKNIRYIQEALPCNSAIWKIKN